MLTESNLRLTADSDFNSSSVGIQRLHTAVLGYFIGIHQDAAIYITGESSYRNRFDFVAEDMHVTALTKGFYALSKTPLDNPLDFLLSASLIRPVGDNLFQYTDSTLKMTNAVGLFEDEHSLLFEVEYVSERDFSFKNMWPKNYSQALDNSALKTALVLYCPSHGYYKQRLLAYPSSNQHRFLSPSHYTLSGINIPIPMDSGTVDAAVFFQALGEKLSRLSGHSVRKDYFNMRSIESSLGGL